MGILCIAGPTASGKSALAVALAQELNGEILSCDSMQIYRGMDIGTAKPTPEEMGGIPHHMLDVVSPGEDFSAGRYREMAEPILLDILARGKTPIIAGGTGLYMDALLGSREFAPAPPPEQRAELEARADREGMDAMLAYLARFDPDSAARLHPADRKRILRAIEIYELTGQTATEHDRLTRSHPPRYDALWIGLWFSDRETLYRRIDRRVDQMLENGLFAETERLMQAGFTGTALQAIGYKELIPALEGHCSRQDAAELLKRNSRRYAKRQMTWLRRLPQLHWIDRTVFPELPQVLAQARQILTAFAKP